MVEKKIHQRRALIGELILISLALGIFTCYFVHMFELSPREPKWSNPETAAHFSKIEHTAIKYTVVVLQICFVILGMLNMWRSEKVASEKRNWSILFLGVKFSFIAGMVLRGWTGKTTEHSQLQKAWVVYILLVAIGMACTTVGIALLQRPFRMLSRPTVFKAAIAVGVGIGQIYLIAAVVAGEPVVGSVLLLISATSVGGTYGLVSVLKWLASRKSHELFEADEEVLITKI